MYSPFSTLLRIHFYSDSHSGFGDAGTFRYVRVSKEDFTAEEFTSFNGRSFTKHKPTPELKERLRSLGWEPKSVFSEEIPRIVSYYKSKFIW